MSRLSKFLPVPPPYNACSLYTHQNISENIFDPLKTNPGYTTRTLGAHFGCMVPPLPPLRCFCSLLVLLGNVSCYILMLLTFTLGKYKQKYENKL